MLYILWAKVREWVTFSSGLSSDFADDARESDLWQRIKYWDIFGEKFLQRLPLLLLLMAVQALYFPINRSGTEGVRVDLDVIDGAMPLVGEFVVPYLAGFWLIAGASFVSALFFPRAIYQEFAISFFLIMIIGFVLWITIPAYVVKDVFTPENSFDQMLFDLHAGDDDYGNYNAFPSSHVYYITLMMYFFTRLWKRWWFLWAFLAVINAWSTMLTHQHYFLDVLTGLLLTIGVIWFTRKYLLSRLRAWDESRLAGTNHYEAAGQYL